MSFIFLFPFCDSEVSIYCALDSEVARDPFVALKLADLATRSLLNKFLCVEKQLSKCEKAIKRQKVLQSEFEAQQNR